MLAILKRYWFLLSLGLAVGSGYIWPVAGEFLIRYEVLTVGLVVSFLLTGLTLESRVIEGRSLFAVPVHLVDRTGQCSDWVRAVSRWSAILDTTSGWDSERSLSSPMS